MKECVSDCVGPGWVGGCVGNSTPRGCERCNRARRRWEVNGGGGEGRGWVGKVGGIYRVRTEK